MAKKLSKWELAVLKRTEYSKTLPKYKFKFEKLIIDPILKLIKKHQLYLTQPENLPQLAKLGYMYNTLWYAGRQCWGNDGLLQGKKMLMIVKIIQNIKLKQLNPKQKKLKIWFTMLGECMFQKWKIPDMINFQYQ